MAILGKLRALAKRLAGEAICDDCIIERLDLPAGTQVDLATRALAGTGGFERRVDICALCAIRKPGILHIAV